MKQSFPKIEKLKSRKRIDKVFREGRSVSQFPLKLIYLPASFPEEVPAQVAVTASKRNFKRAVDRNRVKRLMREAWRLQKYPWLQTMDRSYAMVFIYTGKDLPELKPLMHSMDKLMTKFFRATAEKRSEGKK